MRKKLLSIADFIALAQQHAKTPSKPGQPPPNLPGFFAQWLNSTGIPDFKIEYVIYRTPKGFRIVGKIHSRSIHLRCRWTCGLTPKEILKRRPSRSTAPKRRFPSKHSAARSPAAFVLIRTIDFERQRFPARTRRHRRGEELAESGRYFDAIKEYQRALSIQPGRPLANFRMGEAFSTSATTKRRRNAFREAFASRARTIGKVDRGLGACLSRHDL